MVAKARRVLGLTSRMQHICDQFPSLLQQQLQDQLSLQQDRAAFQTSMANTNGFSPLQVQLPEDLYSSSSSGHKSPVRDSSSPTEIGPALAWKPCRYLARGYCPYGSKCWFWHGPVSQSSGLSYCPYGSKCWFWQGPVSQSSGSSSSATAQRAMRGQEGIASASLEMLEMELDDLLRESNAPVTLSFLPQLYYQRFGKFLQEDGYLTDSQRHGQEGYGLKNLLSRMKGTVTLMDRPDGKDVVVLKDDAPEDLSGENLSSRQIYFTFAAESLITEEDVKAYFSTKYGLVQEVKIPDRLYWRVRYFGFVTFVSSETVKSILSERNGHYICGVRVFVEPYRNF